MEASPQLAARLAQYGALGILLAVFMTLFVWMFKTLFSKFLEHLDILTTTQKGIATALEMLSRTIEENHRELQNETSQNHRELLNQLARHQP